jgi:hypothetical protein
MVAGAYSYAVCHQCAASRFGAALTADTSNLSLFLFFLDFFFLLLLGFG